MDFGWSFRGHENQTVCTITGEIDLHTAGLLERAGCRAMDAHGPCLIVDFSGVTFMDASGITALVRLHKEALERGGYLRLDHVPTQVMRVLVITKMDELLGASRPLRIDLSESGTRATRRSATARPLR
jgi:anti-sigma B factor antagonist